jgi:hypothetical protein
LSRQPAPCPTGHTTRLTSTTTPTTPSAYDATLRLQSSRVLTLTVVGSCVHAHLPPPHILDVLVAPELLFVACATPPPLHLQRGVRGQVADLLPDPPSVQVPRQDAVSYNPRCPVCVNPTIMLELLYRSVCLLVCLPSDHAAHPQYVVPRSRVALFACRIVLSWDEDDYTDNNQILVSLLDPNSDIFTPGRCPCVLCVCAYSRAGCLCRLQLGVWVSGCGCGILGVGKDAEIPLVRVCL